jgi:hypothetical protein
VLLDQAASIQAGLAAEPGAISQWVVDYYRYWLDVCGVIAGALPESQQRFFAFIRRGGGLA